MGCFFALFDIEVEESDEGLLACGGVGVRELVAQGIDFVLLWGGGGVRAVAEALAETAGGLAHINKIMGRKVGRALLGNAIFMFGMYLGFKAVDFFLWDQAKADRMTE